MVCKCAERHLLDPEALEKARNETHAVCVPDLCELAAKSDQLLQEFVTQPAPIIYACHPRAVKALFVHADAPLPEDAQVVDLRSSASKPAVEPSNCEWPPWFPVIDKDRCVNCKQCLEFCLFGVYETDDSDQVRVANPANCKNNCPACARICPEAAIIFPKCGEEPINGAEILDEQSLRANIKNNVDELLGDNIYATLNERKKKRRSLLDRKKVKNAIAEREKWRGTP